MDTMMAFVMGEMNRGKEMKVFDWDKAAELIKEHKPKFARAGLRGDWEYTGNTIYMGGRPVKNTYTYLASTWATPELEINGTMYDCYKMEHEVPDWGANTKWPKSALAILEGRCP